MPLLATHFWRKIVIKIRKKLIAIIPSKILKVRMMKISLSKKKSQKKIRKTRSSIKITKEKISLIIKKVKSKIEVVKHE